MPRPPPPSRSAHLSTPTSSSPCTRARSSTSQSACSRSSPSQSFLSKWGFRLLCTPPHQGSRYKHYTETRGDVVYLRVRWSSNGFLHALLFRGFPTSSQNTRRASEVPSLQELLALVQEWLRPMSGTASTATASVETTAGQCTRVLI